ncbi:MAG TPA: hypothetical protein PLU82_03830, partial [Oscillospiraceae bacterium]|nr:hypothetical protein [Oscillospiraceae bacterium]
HQHFDPPLYFVQNEETVYMYGTYLYNSYGGDNLLGTYTAIHPNCQYQGMSADTDICFVLLQTFKTEDIQKPYAKVAFLKTSYSSAQVKQYEEYTLDVALLEDYIIYQDDTIIVYDFFEFTDAPSLNEQLKSLAEQARFAELGIDLSWISDMRDYFLETDGGVGRFITKS